jgi:glycosyltransferase involved in cell wall biosynthesis
MLLSICIPTFERIELLKNCLNSIYIAKKAINFKFEVCISDNHSSQNIRKIVNYYKKKFLIKYNRNKENLGMGKNIIKSAMMANGKYTWIIGNDDLLFPEALKKIFLILNSNKDVDFFFINSAQLKAKYTLNSKKLFNTHFIPKNLPKFSKIDKNFKLKFLDLINPKIAFDYLLGIYLSIFRTSKFQDNINIINYKLINDKNIFSNFENTAPHVKVFAKSFCKSKAYLVSEPLTVNLSGAREWHKLWDFIEIIRIPEALDEYRKNGLNFFNYHYYKNYSLKNFLPALFKIFLAGKNSNFKYILFYKHIIKNMIYPNFYLSIFYFVIRKIKKYIRIIK